MLYLNPPFHIINGISVLSDHADPLQFYYQPMQPHLTLIENIPQIQLIKYRGNAGDGGFLNFDVNLGLEEDVLDDTRRELQRLHNLREQPRIAPIPILDGTVKMMLFGQESDNPNDDTPREINPDQPQFVLKINHHAKPSLYGNNQAAFSVQLDAAGVTVAEQALRGELSPIGIVYSLDYLALRPAYSVRVKADWNRVQTHLQESFGVDALFFSSSIDKVVDELIEDRLIEIEVDSFIPPGEDAATLLGRLDQAVNEVKDMVLENFFEPSLEPIQEKQDGWDKALHVAERLALLGATGGASAVGGFSYKKVDLTRIDKKHLNVNMSERTTVVRSIHPQAHLRGLSRILQDNNGQVDLERFVTIVDLDDVWFKERKVNVICRANFSSDNVESVNVRLNYEGDSTNVILDNTKPIQTVSWNSVLDNGEMVRNVKASYEVSFNNIDSSERPVTLSSIEEIFNLENLEIRPHELYSQTPVSIIALDFPWNRYPHVEVQVRYADPENKINLEDTFILDTERPEVTWNLFRLDSELNIFDYKLIYRAVDHRDVELPWEQTDIEQITIRDPFPQKRRLEVVPAFNWSEIDMVFVDVHYEDMANNFRDDHSLNFSPDDKKFKTIEIPLIDPEYRFLTYRATVINNNGTVLELPVSTTVANRAIITSTMRGHLIIQIEPEDVDFADRRINQIEVMIRYQDQTAGLNFLDNFSFRSRQDRPRFFEFDYADPQNNDYEYQITYWHSNGLQRTTDWKTSNEGLLIIELV